MYLLEESGKDMMIVENSSTVCILSAFNPVKLNKMIERLNNTDTEQRHAGIRTRKFIKGDNNK